jgi:hypothetical protein
MKFFSLLRPQKGTKSLDLADHVAAAGTLGHAAKGTVDTEVKVPMQSSFRLVLVRMRLLEETVTEFFRECQSFRPATQPEPA